MERERYPERRRCVYPLCEAQVTLIFVPQFPGLPAHDMAKRMQPEHDIINAHLTGPCPMSGQYVGFTPFDPNPPDTQRLIDERMRVDTETAEFIHGRNRVREDIERERRLIQGDRPRHVPESKSLRGPHRMGREPVTPDDMPAWHLGGREDEDSGHESPVAHQHVPSYADGYNMTPGMGRMLISEMRGHLSQAMNQAGQALSGAESGRENIAGATGSVQEALSNLMAVGVEDSPVLQAAYRELTTAEANYRAALDLFEQSAQSLIVSQQKIQDMINGLSI